MKITKKTVNLKKLKIQDILGQQVYVHKPESRPSDKTFSKLFGTVMLNDEKPGDKYYDYMIHFPKINNSFLCHGDHEITGATMDEFPELWL